MEWPGWLPKQACLTYTITDDTGRRSGGPLFVTPTGTEYDPVAQAWRLMFADAVIANIYAGSTIGDFRLAWGPFNCTLPTTPVFVRPGDTLTVTGIAAQVTNGDVAQQQSKVEALQAEQDAARARLKATVAQADADRVQLDADTYMVTPKMPEAYFTAAPQTVKWANDFVMDPAMGWDDDDEEAIPPAPKDVDVLTLKHTRVIRFDDEGGQ